MRKEILALEYDNLLFNRAFSSIDYITMILETMMEESSYVEQEIKRKIHPALKDIITFLVDTAPENIKLGPLVGNSSLKFMEEQGKLLSQAELRSYDKRMLFRRIKELDKNLTKIKRTTDTDRKKFDKAKRAIETLYDFYNDIRLLS